MEADLFSLEISMLVSCSFYYIEFPTLFWTCIARDGIPACGVSSLMWGCKERSHVSPRRL